MKKLLLFNILVLAATASAAFSLTLLDNIVHGTLYKYGLDFSYEWANRYWTMLRIVQASIGLAAVFTVVSSVYVYRKYVYSKAEVPVAKDEKTMVSSSPTMEPEPLGKTQPARGLVKCTNCQRVFAQPLRMLDFQSDRPRIINICPFCNEVIPPKLRHEEESGKKRAPKDERNDQSREPEEMDENEETVAPAA